MATFKKSSLKLLVEQGFPDSTLIPSLRLEV